MDSFLVHVNMCERYANFRKLESFLQLPTHGAPMSPSSSLREKIARSVQKRLVAFFAILVVVISAVLVSFLWQQRRVQVRSLLQVEERRLKGEIEQIRESAEHIAHTLPSGIFADTAGPYEYVDEFTRELEMYGMDLGWIISFKDGVARPWIDGRRRLVLSTLPDDFSSKVAANLTDRPWPQANEGSGRSYRYVKNAPENRIAFLEAFPIYAGSSRVGFVLVGRLFSADSDWTDALRRQVAASGTTLVNLGVMYNGEEIFKTNSAVPGLFHEIIESEASATEGEAAWLKLRAYAQTRDLWVTVGACLFASLLGFAIGLAAIGAWTRRTVSTALLPLQSLVEGTAQLSSGDFSTRVREPEEEELFPLAQKFNFFAASLQQTLENLAAAARKEEEARRRAVEAEIIQLRAQLQPHFLFNSLSMVAQTILDNPDRAYEMTLALADLYRAILRASDKISHSLEDELMLVGSYLHIQAMRFDQRLTYTVPSIPLEFSIQVPSLSLQNLVENALKHGIAPNRGGGHISIRLEILTSRERIIVENNGIPLPPNPQEGTGLKNTRRRWRLLHGESSSLDLEVTDDGRSRSILSVPANKETES
jgi:sensor histidine kinase YesM